MQVSQAVLCHHLDTKVPTEGRPGLGKGVAVPVSEAAVFLPS